METINIHLTVEIKCNEEITALLKKLVPTNGNDLQLQTTVAKTKKCIICGAEFIPASNRQQRCKIHSKTPKKIKRETEVIVDEVEKIRTEREKQPYVFGA